jgi:hypothetical protein
VDKDSEAGKTTGHTIYTKVTKLSMELENILDGNRVKIGAFKPGNGSTTTSMVNW